jgi:exodeoxyribonuclease VIII
MRDIELHFSQLSKFQESPQHFLAAVTKDFKGTGSMRKGSAAHALVFGDRDVVVYDGVRRGKAWDMYQEEHAGDIIVIQSEYEPAARMAESVMRNPNARALIERCRDFERYIKWTRAGLPCGGTPDADGPGLLVDLKSTKTSNPDKFARSVDQYSYHAQLAWYRYGIRANGGTVEECYIVAVESTAPYVTQVFRMTPKRLEFGDRLCTLWMERYRVCSETNTWPGYSETIVDLDVPDYLDDSVEMDFGEEAA